MSGGGLAEPGRDCALCPRLTALRTSLRAEHPDWHNAPVPAFGAVGARLLIVGLAPGVRGANRTGRPFTGDFAGDLLYATLLKFGFARGAYAAARDDGLVLIDTRITNAVRCVPPENKPLPTEIVQCRAFLAAELAEQRAPLIILALGRIAHQQVLAAKGARQAEFPFVHGRFHAVGPRTTLADSYHCSRYNTATRRLTAAMFEQVFAGIRARLDAAPG
jgi:uracil-DNA glycosylase family 4